MKKLLAIWQMIVMAALLLAVTLSIFFPVFTINGDKLMSAMEKEAMAGVREGKIEEEDIDEILNSSQNKGVVESFDKELKKEEEKYGVPLSSISAWNLISASYGDYFDKRAGETRSSNTIYDEARDSLTLARVGIWIFYVGAVLFIVFVVLSYFLKINRYLPTIITAVYSLCGAAFCAYSYWGVPAKWAGSEAFKNAEFLSASTSGIIRQMFWGWGFLATFFIMLGVFAISMVSIFVGKKQAAPLGYGQAGAGFNVYPGDPQGGFDAYPGNPQGGFDAYPGNTQAAFDAYPGNTQRGFDAYPGNTQAAFDAYPGNPQGGFDAYPGNPQGGFDAYPGNTQAAFDAYPGNPQAGFDTYQEGAQPRPEAIPMTAPLQGASSHAGAEPVQKELPNGHSKPMGRVQCIAGVLAGKGYRLPEENKIVIGKDPARCTTVIDYKYVSGVHCSIHYNAMANTYRVQDYSSNGTFVNNVRMQKGVPMEYPAGTILVLADGVNQIKLG